MVSEWINGYYEDKNLWPCWCSVVYIVADELGGDDPAAAKTIARNWESGSFLPYILKGTAKPHSKQEV